MQAQAQAQEATVWHLRQGSRSVGNTSAMVGHLANHTQHTQLRAQRDNGMHTH